MSLSISEEREERARDFEEYAKDAVQHNMKTVPIYPETLLQVARLLRAPQQATSNDGEREVPRSQPGSTRTPDQRTVANEGSIPSAVAPQQAEPVATLHDDGYYTWKSNDLRLKHGSDRAGWRMEVYAAPPPDDDAVRILTELVALKALKDQDWMSYDEKIDYSKRKPLAWEAARAYLARKEER